MRLAAYILEQDPHLTRIFDKLKKKNKKQLEIIWKKLEQIQEDPYRFKPLRSNMKFYREVHIDKHFVLVYKIDESRKTVILEEYEHHDKIFGK